jgi:DNA-binding PadR family transcriptional regulator
MSVGYALLGLLEDRPRYGYDLKREYDERFAHARPLKFGQVYSTLARLLRDQLVDIEAVESGGGPDRKLYAITPAGVTDLERWLREPEPPEPHLQSVLFTKVVLSLLSGRSAAEVLDTQRSAHLRRMRELTEMKRSGDLADALVSDYALFHLEADLRWIEMAGARLDRLRDGLDKETPS